MKLSILDFERSELKQFKNKSDAVKYFTDVVFASSDNSTGVNFFEHCLRYVPDSLLHDPTYINGEWLEVNCHNNSHFIYPTNRVDANTIYRMIEYWHESIAFGKFGDESVEFNFNDIKLQRGYDDFTTDKWLKENLKTIDYLELWQWHDYCNHLEDLERELDTDIDMDTITDDQRDKLNKIYDDCEEYQLDDYIYNTGNGYYGATDIDRSTKRDYIMQNNEYEV